MVAFARYIGIDYSGARTPRSSLSGLRVYMAERHGLPIEVLPPPSPRRYWTRHGVADWLVERLGEAMPTLVGIDHGFSFPKAYFDRYQLKLGWPGFLDDFQWHWPTDGDQVSVELVREGAEGNGAERQGSPRSRRLTEQRAGGAKSVFLFDVQGSVAKSTHAGLPWRGSSGSSSRSAFISGRSTGGTFLRAAPLSLRFTPGCGARVLPAMTAPPISMTRLASPDGFHVPTTTAL